MSTRHALLLTFLFLVACGEGLMSPPAGFDVLEEGDPTESFVAFRSRVFAEPWEGGSFIVDGDVAIPDEKRLREYWQSRVAVYGEHPGALVVHHPEGDARWDSARAHALTYCVSSDFGANHEAVVRDMQLAAEEWEAAADVDFIHLADEDGSCDASNERVLFDVRPVSGVTYYARAFFPNYLRDQRSVLIADSSFSPNQAELTLVGILRHELGHTLGFRHEHTRPESARCFENSQWRPLTEYDRASVMHYPHCNGTGDWTLALTDLDRQGASVLYGAPTDNEDPGPAPLRAGSSHRVFVAAGETRFVGPFDADPGTVFSASIRGWGDADLRVRFGAPPTSDEADCRPFAESANEECHLDVPTDRPGAYVSITGRGTSAVELEVIWEGAAYAGTPVDDHAPMLALANTASFETLDLEVGLNSRAARGVVDARPFATLADLDAASYVGPAALLDIYIFSKPLSDEETILAVANTESLEVLDRDVGLDVRAATNIVAQRPFDTLDALDAVSYVGATAMEKLLAWGRRETEPAPAPAPTPNDEDAAVLDLANHAAFDTLDIDVGLDIRAARGIVERRPFATIAELDAVPWVGDSALTKMRDYLGAIPML